MSKTLKTQDGKDVLLREIKSGDWIVYGAAKGRCAGLNIGKVVKVYVKEDTSWDGRTVIKGTKYTVSSIQVSFGEYEASGTRHDNKKKPRKTTLEFSERICVVPAEYVPQEIKALVGER